MVKAVTDRLSMANGCEKKLREAAHDAPPRPLAQRWMRSLDRGDEVRTPSTGSDRDCEELQDEMDRLEQSIEGAGVKEALWSDRNCEELQDEMDRLEQSVGESGWTR